MANEEIAELFLQYANNNYTSNKNKWKKYLTERMIEFDEDVFSETIIKVYDYIIKNGLTDTSDQGMANYWFRSFCINTKREAQYSRNAYRDLNIDPTEELEKGFNGDDELKQKIRNDVYDDWCVVQIMTIVEQHFDTITASCFRLYYILPKMTYDKLKEVTKIKDCKKRVVTVKKWLKEHLNKHIMEKEFNKYYDGN
jgi:hypothetical protein